MPSEQTYRAHRDRMIFRCVYCGHTPINDLPGLLEHEHDCVLKPLRRADWKRTREAFARHGGKP